MSNQHEVLRCGFHDVARSRCYLHAGHKGPHDFGAAREVLIGEIASLKRTALNLIIAFGVLTAVSFALLFLCCGCATNTGDPAKDRRGRVANAIGDEALKAIFNAAVSFGMSEAQSAMNGQNGQDAAQAAFLAADQAGVSLISPEVVQRIETAYAGPVIGAKIAQAYAQANPATPSQAKDVLNTLGAALQSVANQNAQ